MPRQFIAAIRADFGEAARLSRQQLKLCDVNGNADIECAAGALPAIRAMAMSSGSKTPGNGEANSAAQAAS